MTRPSIRPELPLFLALGFWLIRGPGAAPPLPEPLAAGQGVRSRALPLTTSEARLLQGVPVIKRLCAWRGRTFAMLFVDGTSNPRAIHIPDYCLATRGWALVDQREISTARGPVSWTHSRHGREERRTAHAFLEGSVRHTSWLRFRVMSALARLFPGAVPSTRLIVVTQAGHRSLDPEFARRLFDGPLSP